MVKRVGKVVYLVQERHPKRLSMALGGRGQCRIATDETSDRCTTLAKHPFNKHSPPVGPGGVLSEYDLRQGGVEVVNFN